MDPQIAVQLLLTLAKISGTILAMFMAIIIFALRDEDLAQFLLQGKPHGYLPLFTLLGGCTLLVVQIASSISIVFQINLGEPFDDLRIGVLSGVFVSSIALLLFIFGLLLWEKRRTMKGRARVYGV